MSILSKFTKSQIWLLDNKEFYFQHFDLKSLQETKDISRLKFAETQEEKLKMCLAELICPVTTPERQILSEIIVGMIKAELKKSENFFEQEDQQLADIEDCEETMKLDRELQALDDCVSSIREKTCKFEKSLSDEDKTNGDKIAAANIPELIAAAKSSIEHLKSISHKECGHQQKCSRKTLESVLGIYEFALDAENDFHDFLRNRSVKADKDQSLVSILEETSTSSSAARALALLLSQIEKQENTKKPLSRNVQISFSRSTLDLPKRRLARATEHLIKVPFEYLKGQFFKMGLVTGKSLRRTEITCFTDEDRIRRLVVTDAILCVTSDVVPELASFLEKEYAEVASKLREQPFFPDNTGPTQLSTLNHTFALLHRIRELKKLIESLAEDDLSYIQKYVLEKEIFYVKWIKLTSRLAGNVKLMTVEIDESLLNEMGIKSSTTNSLEERRVCLSGLVEQTDEIRLHCEQIFKNFEDIKVKANEAKESKSRLNSMVLDTMIASGQGEFEWLIYIYDSLKFEQLQVEVFRKEELNVLENRQKNFEYLFYVSHYLTWSGTVKHFADSFVKNSVGNECNSYGLTPWNRNFFRLKESFLKLQFEHIGPKLVAHGAIDLPYYRALSSMLTEPIETVKNKAQDALKENRSNPNDVIKILFQKVSISKNRRKNKATVDALLQLNATELNSKMVDKFMSQSRLENLHASSETNPLGLSDPESAVSDINQITQICKNEALLAYASARVNSILTWVTKTPQLGHAIEKCRKLGEEIEKKIKSLWKNFVVQGGMMLTENEVTIENYNSLCQDVKHSYDAIIKTLKALRDERNINFKPTIDENTKQSLVQLLEEAKEALSLEEGTDEQIKWLEAEKIAITEEYLEFEEVIEMVRIELFRFDVGIIKAKHCCTIVDTVAQMRVAHGNEGVYGHQSQIATRLENTEIGKDAKKLAHILELESDPDLLRFLSTEPTAYSRNKRCLDLWVDRNGAKTTTIGNLIQRLRNNGAVLCAEIVENYRDDVLAKRNKETLKE